MCAYFPYPVKVWLNGYEWAKRQATRSGIGFTALSNGFATRTDPAGLQAICDRLGPGTITVFFERWMSRLPLPLSEADHDAGYWWELSMRQIETSRTIVFDAPRHARAFFEAPRGRQPRHRPSRSCRGDLRRPPRRWGRPPKVEPTYKTRIATRDTVGVTVNADYKHSRVKQYLKDGRALRIETVINHTGDVICKRRLQHLDELQAKARDINRRLLDTERVGQAVSLRAQPSSGSRSPPSTRMAGGRPRYGSEIVGSWPCSAPCVSGLNALGFTNRSLRAQVSHLLGAAYTVNQASYDLARLRLNGLIERRPGTNTYDLTADGQRVAIFYTKVHDRLLRPLIAANQPPAPRDLRDALRVVDHHVHAYTAQARLGTAA
ncbi:hypothetical protein [Ornithinimicrobium sp. LYQ103]|uniref:hypothetical protein n=1 Tax=Ornithinimicrobium sp. LYQ103 TaxID=3378796 RepID=UPI003854A204